MISMIRSDLFRIFKSKGIYIILAITIITSVMAVIMKEPTYIGTGGTSSNDTLSDVNISEIENASFSEMIEIIDNHKTDEQRKEFMLTCAGTNMNMYYFIVFIVFIVLIADFSNHTVKNTLTSVFTKEKYYLSKITLITILSFFLIFFSIFFTYGLNYIINGSRYTCSFGKIVTAVLCQLPLFLGVISILTAFGIIAQKSVIYISGTLSFITVFQSIMSIAYSVTEKEFIKTFMEKYELQQAIYRIATEHDSNYILIYSALGIVAFVVSTIFGMFSFKKSEIK